MTADRRPRSASAREPGSELNPEAEQELASARTTRTWAPGWARFPRTTRLLKSTPVLGRVRVQFILQTGDPKQLVDPKDALVDQDTGTFEVQVLAGKYRIAVYHLDPIPKDKLRGRFDAKNSPVIEDIGPGTKEIVIDVGKKS